MQIRLCYFNEHWNIYLYSTDHTKYGEYNLWSDNVHEITKRIENGEFRLRDYIHPQGIPVYTFGLMLDNPKERPGHGGEWSSNSRSILMIFNINLLEVALDGIAVAVPIQWIKDVLGDQVIWEDDDIYGYKITHVKGHSNDYMKWVELKPQIALPVEN